MIAWDTTARAQSELYNTERATAEQIVGSAGRNKPKRARLWASQAGILEES